VVPAHTTFNIQIGNFTFNPQVVGTYNAKVIFVSNAVSKALDPERKDTAFLRGNCVIAGPIINNCNWDERRVLTINDTTLELINGGQIPITIKEIANVADGWLLRNDTLWSQEGSYFVADISTLVGKTIHPQDGTEEPKSLTFNLGFIPQSEYPQYGTTPEEVRFYLNFEAGAGIQDNTIECVLRGKGILPKIVATGFDYPHTEIDSTSYGYVTIMNTSETADLYIYSIELETNNQYTFFAGDIISIDNHAGTIIPKFNQADPAASR
jgi:hypothetical protein